MPVEMLVESLLPGEGFAAQLAGEVSGSQVGLDVSVQVGLGDELGLTVHTVKLPDARVSLCVQS